MYLRSYRSHRADVSLTPERIDDMYHGFDPELAQLLSADADPSQAGGAENSVTLWARLQGLGLLCGALAVGALLIQF